MPFRRKDEDNLKEKITPELLSGIDAYLAANYREEPPLGHFAETSAMFDMDFLQAPTAAPHYAPKPHSGANAASAPQESRPHPASQKGDGQLLYAPKAQNKYSLSGHPGKRALDEVLGEIGENFQQTLMRTIRERGYTEKEVYKRANLDRKVFSKIRLNENYNPKKSTAILLSLGLRLTLDETLDLLGRAGYTLSNGSRSDLIVRYFIENEIYDVYELDAVLDEYGLPMLSNY